MSIKNIESFEKDFNSKPEMKAVLNAVAQESLSKVGVNREMVTRLDHAYSHKLKSNPITNQKSSGRCWLFS